MYRFQVEGISCNKCATTIRDAIQQFDEKANVDVHIEEQAVDVDSALPGHVIERAIVDAGYPVKEMIH